MYIPTLSINVICKLPDRIVMPAGIWYIADVSWNKLVVSWEEPIPAISCASWQYGNYLTYHMPLHNSNTLTVINSFHLNIIHGVIQEVKRDWMMQITSRNLTTSPSCISWVTVRTQSWSVSVFGYYHSATQAVTFITNLKLQHFTLFCR